MNNKKEYTPVNYEPPTTTFFHYMCIARDLLAKEVLEYYFAKTADNGLDGENMVLTFDDIDEIIKRRLEKESKR